ncbi:MAG TPA: outer membrane beta-barrel protein [Bacteroidales bacterium]|nr:outer membrane beta-barrel protein [Bacteroidales bacterium]HSA43759.1 outer membrane beta-barrel protein [Bacteroidales bacterium]
MKTKALVRLLILTGCIALLPLLIQAQKYYIRFNAAYSTGNGNHTLNQFYLYDDIFDSAQNLHRQISTSLGKGLSFGLTGGYQFNESLAGELNVLYLLGSKTTAEHSFYENWWEYSISSTMLQISPCLVISGKWNKVVPYARLGLLLGIGSIKYIAEEFDMGVKERYEWRFDQGLAMGLTSGIGIQYPLNQKMMIFSELTNVNMSWAPRRGTLEKAEVDGQDIFDQLSVRDKEIEFEEDVDFLEYNPSNNDVPNKQPSVNFPYGSLGLQVGVKLNL